MDMKELSVEKFSERIARGTPMPGGVSACAAAAALAAALVQMGAKTAMKQAADEEARKRMEAVDESAEILRKGLLKLIQRDSAAYGMYMAALGLPKATGKEITLREDKKQAALKNACLSPLQAAERSLRVLALANMCLQFRGGAVADVLSGALLARSAALGAERAVKYNLRYIADVFFERDMARQCAAIKRNARRLEKSARAAYFTFIEDKQTPDK